MQMTHGSMTIGVDRGRVLLLSPVSPYPAQSGASQRTFLLMQALRQRMDVDLALVNNDVLAPDVRDTLTAQFNLVAHLPSDHGDFPPRRWNFNYPLVGTPLRRLTRMLLGGLATLYRSPAMSAGLQRVLAQKSYQAIVGRYLASACQTDAWANLPVFLDVDDLPSEIWFSHATAAQASGRWVGTRCATRIAHDYQRLERECLARCAGVWVAKEKDRAAVPSGHAGLLPNIPFASYPDGVKPLAAPEAVSPIVLGVGLFDWLPNKTGFDWFVREVWPLVRQQRPDARLHLVGKLSDSALLQAWEAVPGVSCLGRVADLQACYQQATLAVAPIFSGGGTNIKVIEALSYGRCCVLTPHAAKGFEAMAGLSVADGAGPFAAACVAALSDPASALARGLEASDSANAVFSFSGFAQAVHQVMAQATPDRSLD